MKKHTINPVFYLRNFFISLVALLAANFLHAQKGDTVYAEIAAIDQPFMLNRLGAAMPTGMIFALLSDLKNPNCKPGEASLREDKRPRPIVLRANVGNVVKIKFKNLLDTFNANGVVNPYGTNRPDQITQSQITNSQGNLQVTRAASLHIKGMEMVDTIASDGSYNGKNLSSLVKPGDSIIYTLLAAEEGTFMLYSTGADMDNYGGLSAAQLGNGLFGTINIQPEGAEWYRSQVSEADLNLAIKYYIDPQHPNVQIPKNTVDIYTSPILLFPVIDYDKHFPNGNPVLKMYEPDGPHRRKLVYTDLTAIITGPNAGNFTSNSPSFEPNPASPDRRQPYREFSIDYHEMAYAVQAFPVFYDYTNKSAVQKSLNPVIDGFAINYGTGGIGAEIIANRIGVGPMAKCADCAFEEFFLSAWAVGDPSMVVDIPANSSGTNQTAIDTTLQNQLLLFESQVQSGLDTVRNLSPQKGYKATKALYPDDPSNVYHSYMNDHVKFRITHTGMGITHVHHQHAHQWLHTPNSSDSHYLDSQAINPGSSYTLEITYGGSGNLNKTVGDQIFHCHFYPHFASGMWSMWRVHDVLELGTQLDPATQRPLPNSRALPDAEIKAGTPIPGLVPIPTLAMAPPPSKIHIDNTNGQAVVENIKRSPGFPFYIPGIAGSRPPNPPLDFAKDTIYNKTGNPIGFGSQNGGLPRSVVLKADVPWAPMTLYDYTKVLDKIQIIELPEDGTAVEKIAMKTHATRNHSTLTPTGMPGTFLLNGRPAVPGASFC